MSMIYIASYPVFLHNLRLREKMKQTLLIQLCYLSYKLLVNYKHTTYLTNLIVHLDSS